MEIQRRRFVAAVGAGAVTMAAGCARSSGSVDRPDVAGETLTLTTTTSTYDTGLLDAIHPDFETRYGVSVDVVAQGTGAALKTARNGDSDVVLVHARDLEDEFMREGYGVNRRALMFNDFVIVGPEGDPAEIAGADSATEALTTIAKTEATFVSRGDNSGTHTKELHLWEAAAGDPGGEWYQETGTGMGEALTVATQQGAYTLADRGTYLSQRSNLDLAILVEGPIEGGPETLANPYGVMAVNPAVHNDVEYDLAMAYIGWLTSPDVQNAIADYESDGEQLFYPEALSEDPDFQQYVPEGWRDESTGA
ncbi:MAG: substrate-binding domain-containing protein [Halapricum sp.]